MVYTCALQKRYKNDMRSELQKEFTYKSIMQIPKIEKVVISMGLGYGIANKKIIEAAVNELSLLAGQKAVRTRAKKSISNFKLRENMEVGAKVTLRNMRMYEFLERLIHIALPRVKDFRGINANSFDGHGNFSFGILEQIIFPEINYDKIERINGMNITIVTSANTDKEAYSLLQKIGIPFKK